MADLTDVQNTLVALIAQTLYPNGTAQPSITGAPTVVYAGWPTAANLDADLAALANGAGKLHVTVYPTATERNTTRYPKQWQPQTPPAPTLMLTISGQQVSVGGAVMSPQNVMLLINHQPIVYAVQPGDTLTTVAAALATLVSGATSAGPTLTLPANALITAARAGSTGVSIMEIRRQERVFQITVWADTPAHRDVTAQAIDVALAGIERLVMPDQSSARLIYRSSAVNDMLQKANLYRRDLLYSVEYATTVTETDTEITQTQTNTNTPASVVTTYD